MPDEILFQFHNGSIKRGALRMSDKLQLKGNIVVSDSNVLDWFEFENRVLKAIKNNQHHTVNAVCVFRQYVGPEIMGSYKLDGKLCTWRNFAAQVIATQVSYRDWLMSCTVTLKASKKGKAAQKAFEENKLDMFATTPPDAAAVIEEERRKHIESGYGVKFIEKNPGDDPSDDTVAGNLFNELIPGGFGVEEITITHASPKGTVREVDLRAK